MCNVVFLVLDCTKAEEPDQEIDERNSEVVSHFVNVINSIEEDLVSVEEHVSASTGEFLTEIKVGQKD